MARTSPHPPLPDPPHPPLPYSQGCPCQLLPSAAKCCQVLPSAAKCMHPLLSGRTLFYYSLPPLLQVMMTSRVILVVNVVVGVVVVVLVVEGMVLGPLLNPGDVLLVFPIPVLQLVLW